MKAKRFDFDFKYRNLKSKFQYQLHQLPRNELCWTRWFWPATHLQVEFWNSRALSMVSIDLGKQSGAREVIAASVIVLRLIETANMRNWRKWLSFDWTKRDSWGVCRSSSIRSSAHSISSEFTHNSIQTRSKLDSNKGKAKSDFPIWNKNRFQSFRPSFDSAWSQSQLQC